MPSTLKRLPKLSKAPGLKRLPGLPGPKRSQRLPDLSAAMPEELAPDQTEERRIARAVGDESLAKRVVSLQKKFPVGTVLELVIYDWLSMKKIAFDYQVAVFGGRAHEGGKIPDFVIKQSAEPDAWLANGVYWHTRPGNEQADAGTKMKLAGALLPNGQRIRRVLIIWEDKIVTPAEQIREQTLNMALAGAEIPR